jgi:7,8-dihydropterin-6-yl-methyl-4-(beta-D-ribofuranosyl)aminobenzene 5'-phosphate synthase
MHKAFLVSLLLVARVVAASEPATVQTLKITVLSTMLAERDELGEWGFAALVEVDGHRLLFDTGARPDTVLQNANTLGIPLADIQDVVLSHNHGDHTGGLAYLRTNLRQQNEHAFGRAHVAPQIFWPRVERGREWTSMRETKAAYEAAGGRFIIHESSNELFPGVWLSGPIPRRFVERNWPSGIVLRTPQGAEVEDSVPEDIALIINTPEGLVVLSGCGHAGIVNTVDHARRTVRAASVAALIGGFHLFSASDAHMKWTGAKLRPFRVATLLGGHCTGIEAVYQLRSQLGLSRRTAIVAAVGSSYTLGRGLDAGGLGLAK